MSYGTFQIVNRLARQSVVTIQSGIERTVSRSVKIQEERLERLARLVRARATLTTKVARDLCDRWIESI